MNALQRQLESEIAGRVEYVDGEQAMLRARCAAAVETPEELQAWLLGALHALHRMARTAGLVGGSQHG